MANSKDDTRGAWEPPKIFRDVRFLYALVAITFFLPFLLTRGGSKWLDFTDTGQIGDTIGGIMGPMVGLIGAILTYMAFYEQYRANQIIVRRQRAEEVNRMFELYLKEFRESVLEWEITDYLKSKSCSYHWLREFGDLVSVFNTIQYNVCLVHGKNSFLENESFTRDLVFLIMIKGQYYLRDAKKWVDNPYNEPLFQDIIQDSDVILEKISRGTRQFIDGRPNSLEIEYDGFVDKKITIKPDHPYLKAEVSNFMNSFLLLDSLLLLTIKKMDSESVDAIGAKRIIAGFLHGSLGWLYYWYQHSRFGNPDLRPFVETVMMKRFSELDNSV